MSLLLVTLLFFFTGTGLHAQCTDVDLQAVSIDPSHPFIGKGQTASITVAMKNNSACPILTGEATAQITFSAVYLDLGDPVNFKDICGQWTYLGAVSDSKQHNLFFRNNGGPIPPGGKFCSFHFEIKGKAVTSFPVAITLASSLSATATTADINGSNQSTSTELHVRASATPVPAQAPTLLTDFSVTAKECNAMLAWKTTAENKVDSFEVQYGTDGIAFNKVGAVESQHNTAGGTYQYTNDQGNGRGYYRLRIVEQGGKSSYSKIVSADTKCIIKKGF